MFCFRDAKINKMKVLYLGMAHDIMSPLLLVPNVKTIYSIDSFDPCFSSDKTWEGQKQDIKQVLTQGNDFDTRTYHCYTRYPEKEMYGKRK